MGLSGLNGKMYVNVDWCPGDGNTAGSASLAYYEVTRFVIADSVQKREYGHDKSNGWQAAVAGIRKATITIDAMVVKDTGELAAGQQVYLELYPLGEDCGTAATGGALVDSVNYTTDIETGAPVSFTATLSSIGAWTGLGGDGGWGGTECGCGGSSDA
jgi:hypothetical protein